jgi:hypothetical protein
MIEFCYLLLCFVTSISADACTDAGGTCSSDADCAANDREWYLDSMCGDASSGLYCCRPKQQCTFRNGTLGVCRSTINCESDDLVFEANHCPGSNDVACCIAICKYGPWGAWSPSSCCQPSLQSRTRWVDTQFLSTCGPSTDSQQCATQCPSPTPEPVTIVTTPAFPTPIPVPVNTPATTPTRSVSTAATTTPMAFSLQPVDTSVVATNQITPISMTSTTSKASVVVTPASVPSMQVDSVLMMCDVRSTQLHRPTTTITTTTQALCLANPAGLCR